ncbi:HXXEE domain-containing protein [Fusibacter bizertensis]|uniref:HXXEE domain-containing protein n=1 Tax=Fusibacter bizertensis TaxID=1488331 RepID=A0ABT6NF47_9FIRM|nr:HXXEE domain-containing protein [Fusibacter bizertensis]MDH8679036.1 HXXEE domain-containing protein [Fusibacter bizertensis]
MLEKKSLVSNLIIASLMGILFWYMSSGLSLIVTFVVGVIFVFGLLLYLYKNQNLVWEKDKMIQLYLIMLSVQFVHFAEEYVTGFAEKFPLLYGGVPYSDNMFVIINMVSYFIFTITAMLVLTRNNYRVMTPMLFFIVYGAMGNAIAHTVWSIYLAGYFPGLYTAQLYWIVGPLMLNKVIGDWKKTIGFITLYAIVLSSILIIFIN